MYITYILLHYLHDSYETDMSPRLVCCYPNVADDIFSSLGKVSSYNFKRGVCSPMFFLLLLSNIYYWSRNLWISILNHGAICNSANMVWILRLMNLFWVLYYRFPYTALSAPCLLRMLLSCSICAASFNFSILLSWFLFFF